MSSITAQKTELKYSLNPAQIHAQTAQISPNLCSPTSSRRMELYGFWWAKSEANIAQKSEPNSEPNTSQLRKSIEKGFMAEGKHPPSTGVDPKQVMSPARMKTTRVSPATIGSSGGCRSERCQRRGCRTSPYSIESEIFTGKNSHLRRNRGDTGRRRTKLRTPGIVTARLEVASSLEKKITRACAAEKKSIGTKAGEREEALKANLYHKNVVARGTRSS